MIILQLESVLNVFQFILRHLVIFFCNKLQICCHVLHMKIGRWNIGHGELRSGYHVFILFLILISCCYIVLLVNL